VALGSRVYFCARDKEVWASDGTAGGTLRIMGFPANIVYVRDLHSDGSRLFVHLATFDGITNHDELWVSDGTTAGTSKLPVEDVVGFKGIAPVSVGGKFFFTCNSGRELWVTDGTAAGTLRLAADPNWGRAT